MRCRACVVDFMVMDDFKCYLRGVVIPRLARGLACGVRGARGYLIAFAEN